MFKRIISLTVSIGLLLQQTVFAYTANLNLSNYLNSGTNQIALDRYRPVSLRYFSYQPQTNDFKVLLDKGDYARSPGHQDTKSAEKEDSVLKEAAKELMGYFKIGLTLSNDKFWVNLRPDSEDEIIDEELAKTDLGKVMLEADLKLKQDTSLFTSPSTPQGKEYWNKLYKKTGELFGTENITIPTLTRPWIVPGEIILRESNDKSSQGAYIYKANLKVLLEDDYLTSRGERPFAPTYKQYEFNDPRLKELNQYSTQLIRELILPRLTQKVNSSKDYANLRQVYFSLILARWFKETFSSQPIANSSQNNDSYVNLIDSNNLTNLTSKQAWDKATYFKTYQKSFQEGEYNLSEPIYTPTGQVIRRYMSGGAKLMPELLQINNGYTGKENIASSAIMRSATQVFFTEKELSQKQFIDSKKSALDIFYPIDSGLTRLTDYAVKFNDILGVNKSFLNEEEKGSLDNLLKRIRENREQVNAIRDELKEIPEGAAEPLSSLGAAWKILNKTQAFLIEEAKSLSKIINSIQPLIGYEKGKYLNSSKEALEAIIKNLSGRVLLIREINSEKENLSHFLDNMKKQTIVIDAKCLLSYVDGHTNDTNIVIRFNKNGDISLFSKDNTPGYPILKFKLGLREPKEIETESYSWERKIDDLSPEGAYNLVGAIKEALERANNASSAINAVMDEQLQLMSQLSKKTASKIFYLVIDGLGGMPVAGKTELDKAIHPNLDELSQKASVGSMNIVDTPGITPGSGPGHFAIFGYDPYKSIGRGVLDALGAEVELEQGDIVARGNFSTLSKEGIITDRRAGRIKTEDAEAIIKQRLSGIEIEGVKFLFYSTKDHRVALVIRGKDLSSQITDSDPGKDGLAPHTYKIKTRIPPAGAENLARLMNKLTEQINERLRDNTINLAANTVLFRGFDSLQEFPGLKSVYRVTPAAICTYPAYKGIAKILGMDVLPISGQTLQNQVDALRSNLNNYDFFYFHVKQTDSAGEDGNFEAKVKKIEEVDAMLPQILNMMNLDNGDTLVVTGDHSTPARIKAHSWHPVPVLIYSKNSFPMEKAERFTERQAAQGHLGKVIGRHIMPLVMAEAEKLEKLDGPITFSSGSPLTVEDLRKIEWGNVLFDSLREIFEERLRKIDEYHGKLFVMENFRDPFIMARYDKQKIGVIKKAIEAARLYWEAPSEIEEANRKELRVFLTESLDSYCQKILSEIKEAFSDSKLKFLSNDVSTATADRKKKRDFLLKQINEIEAYYFGKKGPDIDYRGAHTMPGRLNWAIRIHKMMQYDVSIYNILEQFVPNTSSAIMSMAASAQANRPDSNNLSTDKTSSPVQPFLTPAEFGELVKQGQVEPHGAVYSEELMLMLKNGTSIVGLFKKIEGDFLFYQTGDRFFASNIEKLDMNVIESITLIDKIPEDVLRSGLDFRNSQEKLRKIFSKTKIIFVGLEDNPWHDNFFNLVVNYQAQASKEEKITDVIIPGYESDPRVEIGTQAGLNILTVGSHPNTSDYQKVIQSMLDQNPHAKIVVYAQKEFVAKQQFMPKGYQQDNLYDFFSKGYQVYSLSTKRGLKDGDSQYLDSLGSLAARLRVGITGDALIDLENSTLGKTLTFHYTQRTDRGDSNEVTFRTADFFDAYIVRPAQPWGGLQVFGDHTTELLAQLDDQRKEILTLFGTEGERRLAVAAMLLKDKTTTPLRPIISGFWIEPGVTLEQVNSFIDGLAENDPWRSGLGLRLTNETAAKTLDILKPTGGESPTAPIKMDSLMFGDGHNYYLAMAVYPKQVSPGSTATIAVYADVQMSNLRLHYGFDASRNSGAWQRVDDRPFAEVDSDKPGLRKYYTYIPVPQDVTEVNLMPVDRFGNSIKDTMGKDLVIIVSSALAQTEKPEIVGGIDFRQMNMLIRPQGSFASSSLDFSLPALSKAEIESFDLDTELAAIQRMADSGIAPSYQRLKEYLAVCFAKERTGKDIDNLKLCLLDIFEKEQFEAKETPDGYKEVLVIADTKGYVLRDSRLAVRGQNSYSLN